MIGTYLLVYGLIPAFIYKNKLVFSALVLAVLILVTLADRVLIQQLLYPIFYGKSEYTFVFWDWYRLSGFFVHVITTSGMMAGFKYFRDWQLSQQRILEMDKEKRRSELQFLRAQAHPHFLFNALNAIYYETGKDTVKAQGLILQFSEFLRFTMSESMKEFVPIDREEALIRSYVAIQQSRFGPRIEVEIEWKVEGTEKLPPMLCFFLVENAFKHGALESGDLARIQIEMRRKAGILEFRVENPLAEQKAADPLKSREGIGLRNLQRQLELIYHSTHSYSTETKNGRYSAVLTIPIEA